MAENDKTTDDPYAEAGAQAEKNWQAALEHASNDIGPALAASTMFVISARAMLAALGQEDMAELIGQMAQGIRDGKDITMSVTPSNPPMH